MSTSAETDWRRPLPPPAALRRDVVIGVVLAALSAFGIELARGLGAVTDRGAGGVEVYLWAAAIALPLCVRRRYPISVMVACSLLYFVAGERIATAVGNSVATQAVLFLSIYSAQAWSRQRHRLVVVTWVVVAGMAVWLVYGFVRALEQDKITGSDDALLSPYLSYLLLNTGINIAYFWGAVLWGRTAWRTARQHEMLQRQAVELATQQEANARRAVVEERLRIARELHDVVAHHISSIGIQAGGARRVLDQDPSASRDALAVIERSSRRAVAEMRQLLGTLRADDTSQPGSRTPTATSRPPVRPRVRGPVQPPVRRTAGRRRLAYRCCRTWSAATSSRAVTRSG